MQLYDLIVQDNAWESISAENKLKIEQAIEMLPRNVRSKLFFDEVKFEITSSGKPSHPYVNDDTITGFFIPEFKNCFIKPNSLDMKSTALEEAFHCYDYNFYTQLYGSDTPFFNEIYLAEKQNLPELSHYASTTHEFFAFGCLSILKQSEYFEISFPRLYQYCMRTVFLEQSHLINYAKCAIQALRKEAIASIKYDDIAKKYFCLNSEGKKISYFELK